jgi:hypothetical protein
MSSQTIEVAPTQPSNSLTKNENKFEKLALFSTHQNVVQPHHLSHAIHHDLTTKTPQQSHVFF